MTDRVEKNIELKASVEHVWSALTDHKEFGTWFGVNLEGPFVVGQVARGRITHPCYEHVIWEVKIVKMERPLLFALTWHPYAVDPDRDYSQEPSTLVEFRLESTAAGTRLSVVESGFDALPADGAWKLSA